MALNDKNFAQGCEFFDDEVDVYVIMDLFRVICPRPS